MKRDQVTTPISFDIFIEGSHNYTWQGKLIAEGQNVYFRSELELLAAIEHLLCDENENNE